MTNKVIIAIVLAAAILSIDVLTDYFKWKKDRNIVKPEGSVKHKSGWWIVVAALIPSAILSGYIIFPVIAFGYWHLKDGSLNLLMKQNFFRLGTTAGTDTAQRKHPYITVAKYLGLALSVAWIIIKK